MSFRRLLACLVLLTISSSAFAAPRLIPDLKHLDAVPLHSLPLLNMRKAVSDAKRKDRPLQFAVAAAMPLSLDDGAWKQLDDGSWSWRTRVYSAGAQTLNLHFSKFHLPEGATLWLYDPSGTVIAGPYTSANELGDEQLWTAVVNSETVIVEVLVPDAVKNQVELQLAEVNHGYRGFEKAGTGSFGDSGACETDVICSAGTAYSAEARAVARITINGNTLCSGQLINNVRKDNTPFFLTANHCGISNSNASSVVFYWNYQNSVCGGNGTEPGYDTQSGSLWLAGDSGSDFTLIKTAQAPNAAFNLYLAGWNAGSSAPTSGGIVHHPSGDVTKISLYNSKAGSTDNAKLCVGEISALGACLGTTRTIKAWVISYSLGVTEPGSSGSALYDQNHRIVGQLSGGASACSGSGSNGETDFYARTNAGWTASSSASGQLKAHLDPDNSGTLAIDGKNLGAFTGTSSGGSGSSGGGSSGSSSGGGGALPPLTLAGLLMLGLLRRRATSRRASSV
jgi:hypothetical protein